VEYTRQLILVPILHTMADMGTMAEGLEAAYVERFGRRHWEEFRTLVDGFWPMVRADLEALSLDYHRVDLYQDGLPVCGRELEIVQKAAEAGSDNHQILLDLLAKGAALMGTEDPSLLLEEYRSLQSALKPCGGGPAGYAPASLGRDMLNRRDAYIGQRIGQTLLPRRTGVLFLGMMHDVESHLPEDIIVRRVVPPILASRAKGR
jgi:hypothetical protein